MDKRSIHGPKARRNSILSHLLTHGNSTVEQLAELLSVSQMTVYRDVAELESLQLVQRRNGLISPAASSLSESSAHLRQQANQPQKKRLAKAVMKHITRGMSLLVDDSTSNISLVEDLSEVTPITVVTNAEFIAKIVRLQEDAKLILVGGEYEPWADSYFGDITIKSLDQLRVDLCVMSATALTATHAFHPDQRVADVKRQMLASADKKILVADSSKFTKNALYKVGPLTDFDLVITDSETPKTVLEQLADQDIPVEVVR